MEKLLVDDVPAKPASGKLGRYEIVKRLANSGMAELLLARITGGGSPRHIVIKQLREHHANDAAFVKTFVAEARLASALHHHNIVQVQDIGEENGKHYVAMEYIHGKDLRTILARLHDLGQMMPIEHLVTIGKSVAAALHHAHEQAGADRKPLGMVHGDVTPTNILVGYDGNVKVVDFGIAKAALHPSAAQLGGLSGKVPYMAPEHCTGQVVDRRSDVFALGIVLYELATVRRLFKRETEFLTMATIIAGTVPAPSQHHKDVPDELDKIILKALSRSPADRYQTAADLRAALDRFASKAKLIASVTVLADYMKQLFAERTEPWLDASEPTAVPTIDFDGAAPGLALPSAEAVDAFALPATAKPASDSPIARARARAVTSSPTTSVRLPKKPVVLESFVQKPKPEAKAKLPKPKTNAKLEASPRDDTEVTSAVPPGANTDVNPTVPPTASADRTPNAPPSASAAGAPPPRPKSDTAGAPPPRPRSDTAGAPPPRPRSNTAGAPLPRPRSDTAGASSKAAGNRLPSPLQTPRSMPVVAPPIAPPVVTAPVVTPPVVAPVAGVLSVRDRLSTDVDETTSVANPPPPPVVIASTAVHKASEVTEIVTPLPSPLDPPAKRGPRAPTPPVIVEPGLAEPQPTRANHRKRIVAGLIGVTAVIAVILIVVIGFSSDDVTRAGPPVGSEPAAASSPEIKPAPAEPAPEPPRPERTMRNSEPPPTTDVAAQVPAEPPPSKLQVPPKDAVTPPPIEATPPKQPSSPPTALAPSPPKRTSSPGVTHKPVQVAKPVAKPPTKPQTKPAKQPTYDPNALFLKKP